MLTINEPLSASLEDYLEAIFHIEVQKHAARAKDIAERLQVSRASVTGALRNLSQKKLVNYAPYDIITLTTKGKAIAEDIVHRHTILRDFLIKVLGIEEADAEETACKMEHSMSEIVAERLTQFIKFLDSCPRGGHDWMKGFTENCEFGKNHEQCETCLAEWVDDIKSRWVKEK